MGRKKLEEDEDFGDVRDRRDMKMFMKLINDKSVV